MDFISGIKKSAAKAQAELIKKAAPKPEPKARPKAAPKKNVSNVTKPIKTTNALAKLSGDVTSKLTKQTPINPLVRFSGDVISNLTKQTSIDPLARLSGDVASKLPKQIPSSNIPAFQKISKYIKDDKLAWEFQKEWKMARTMPEIDKTELEAATFLRKNPNLVHKSELDRIIDPEGKHPYVLMPSQEGQMKEEFARHVLITGDAYKASLLFPEQSPILKSSSDALSDALSPERIEQAKTQNYSGVSKWINDNYILRTIDNPDLPGKTKTVYEPKFSYRIMPPPPWLTPAEVRAWYNLDAYGKDSQKMQEIRTRAKEKADEEKRSYLANFDSETEVNSFADAVILAARGTYGNIKDPSSTRYPTLPYAEPMKDAAKAWYGHIIKHLHKPVTEGYGKIAFVNFLGSLTDNLDLPTRPIKGLFRRSAEAGNPNSPYYFVYSGGADIQESYNFAEMYKKRRKQKTNIRATVATPNSSVLGDEPYLTKYANDEYLKYERERNAYNYDYVGQDLKYSLTTLNSPEFNTGNSGSDFVYEMLSDPTLIIGISAGLIRGSASSTLKQSAKQISKSVAEDAGEKVAKSISKGVVRDVLNNPRLTDKQIKNLINVTVSEPLKEAKVSSEVIESVNNRFYRTVKDWRHSYNYRIYESVKKLERPIDIVDLSLLGVSVPVAAFGVGAFKAGRKIYNRTEFVSKRARKKIFDSKALKTFLGYDVIDEYLKEVPLEVLAKDKGFEDEVRRSLMYNINELDKVRLNIKDISELESAINQRVFELTDGACNNLNDFILQQHPILAVTNPKELAQLKYFQDVVRASQSTDMVPAAIKGTKSEILTKSYGSTSEFLDDMRKHGLDESYFGKIDTLDDVIDFQEKAKIRRSADEANSSFINVLSEPDITMVEYFNKHRLNKEGKEYYKKYKKYPELTSIEDVQKYYDLNKTDAARLLNSSVGNNAFLRELRVQRNIADDLLSRNVITEDQYADRIMSLQRLIDTISNDSQLYNVRKTLDDFGKPFEEFIKFNDELLNYTGKYGKMPKLSTIQDINKYFEFDYNVLSKYDWKVLGYPSEDDFIDAVTDRAVSKLLGNDPRLYNVQMALDFYNGPFPGFVKFTDELLNYIDKHGNIPRLYTVKDINKYFEFDYDALSKYWKGSGYNSEDEFMEMATDSVVNKILKKTHLKKIDLNNLVIPVQKLIDSGSPASTSIKELKTAFDDSDVLKIFYNPEISLRINKASDDLKLPEDDLLNEFEQAKFKKEPSVDELIEGSKKGNIDEFVKKLPGFSNELNRNKDYDTFVTIRDILSKYEDDFPGIATKRPFDKTEDARRSFASPEVDDMPPYKGLSDVEGEDLIGDALYYGRAADMDDIDSMFDRLPSFLLDLEDIIKHAEKHKEFTDAHLKLLFGTSTDKKSIDYISSHKKVTEDDIDSLKSLHNELTKVYDILPSKHEYDFANDYVVFKVNSQDKVESFISEPTYAGVVESVIGNGPAKYDLDYIREGALYYDDRILNVEDVSDIKNFNYYNNCKEFYEGVRLSEVYNTMRASIKNDPELSTLVKLSLLDSLAKRGKHSVDEIIENMNINLLVQGGKRVSLDSFRTKKFADDIAKLPESKKEAYTEKVSFLCEGGHTDPMDDILMQEFVMRRHNPTAFKEDTLLLDIETTGTNSKAHNIFSVAYYEVKGGETFKNFEDLVDYMYAKKKDKTYAGKTLSVKYSPEQAAIQGPSEDVAGVFYNADKKLSARDQWIDTYTVKEGESEFTEKELLEELLKQLTPNKRVATYNMNGYDLKFISDRLDMHRVANPTNKIVDVDGMAQVKDALNVEYVTNSDRRIITDYVERIDQLFGERGFSPMSPTNMYQKLRTLEKDYIDIAKIDPTVQTTSTKYVIEGDQVIRKSRYDDNGNPLTPQSLDAVEDLKVLAESYRQEHVSMESQVYVNTLNSGVLPDNFQEYKHLVGEQPNLANVLRHVSGDGEFEFAYKNYFKGSTVGLVFDAERATLSNKEAKLMQNFSTHVLKTRDNFLYLPKDASDNVTEIKNIIKEVNEAEIFPVNLKVPEDIPTLHALALQLDYYHTMRKSVDFPDELAVKIEDTVDNFRYRFKSRTTGVNKELVKLKKGQSSLAAVSRVFDNTGTLSSKAYALIGSCKPLDEALDFVKNLNRSDYRKYVKTAKAYHNDLATHQARTVADVLVSGSEEDIISFLYYYAPFTVIPKKYIGPHKIASSKMYSVHSTDNHFIVYLNKNFEGNVTSQKYFKSYQSSRMFPQSDMLTVRKALEESNASIAQFAGPGSNASTGIVLSSHNLERKALKLPTSVQMNMWDINKMTSPDKFNNIRFDFTSLGMTDEVYDFGMYTIQDPLLNNTKIMEKLMSGHETATQYMMLYTGSHDNLGVRNMFPKGTKTKDIIQALKDSPEYTAVYVTKSKSKFGFKVNRMDILDEADLKLAETRKAIIVPYQVYEDSFQKLNSLPIQHPLMKKVVSAIYVFKAFNLFMPKTWNNNMKDSLMKGAMDTKDFRYLINIFKSDSIVRDYNKILKAMVKYTGEQNTPPTKLREIFELLSKTEDIKIDFEQFELVHGLLNGSVVAGEASSLARDLAIERGSKKLVKMDDIVNEDGTIVKHLKYTDADKVKNAAGKYCKEAGVDLDAFMAYVFKPGSMKRTSVNPEMSKIYDKVVRDLFVPISKRVSRGAHYSMQGFLNTLLRPMGAVESRVRVGHLLTLTDQGFNKSSALNRVSKTHFNYNMKGTKMKYLEMAVPFAFFEINNMAWWLDMALNKPGVVKMALRAQNEVSFNAWDYDNEELATNSSLLYAIAAGNIPINKWGFKYDLNLSYLSVLENIMDPFSSINSKLLPPLQYGMTKLFYERGGLVKSLMDESSYWGIDDGFFPTSMRDTLGVIRSAKHLMNVGTGDAFDRIPDNVANKNLYKMAITSSLFSVTRRFGEDAHSFDEFQRQLLAQGKWYDANRGMVRPLSDIEWTGLNKLNMSWDEVAAARLRLGEIYDRNLRAFVPIGQWSPTMLNDPTLPWEEVAYYHLNFFDEVWDNNIWNSNTNRPGKWVRSKDMTQGGLNDPNLTHEQRNALMMKIHGFRWDNNTGTYIPMEDWKPTGLNEPDLSWNEFSRRMYEIRGLEWDNNIKKFVPAGTSTSGRFNPTTGQYEWNKRTYRRRNYRRRIYRRYGSAVRKFKKNRSRQFTSQENKWFHYEHLKTSPSSRLVSKVFAQARNTHNYVSLNNYNSYVSGISSPMNQLKKYYHDFYSMPKMNKGMFASQRMSIQKFLNIQSNITQARFRPNAQMNPKSWWWLR